MIFFFLNVIKSCYHHKSLIFIWTTHKFYFLDIIISVGVALYNLQNINLKLPTNCHVLKAESTKKKIFTGFSGCGTNEIYQRCKKSCPPDTCISLVAKFKCDSEALCTSGCTCKPGFLRKISKGPCIPIRECPQLANSPDFN